MKGDLSETTRHRNRLADRRATIRDVAREAGVAVMTVSRVINGGTYVSLEAEARVRVAIERLGYKPNEAARVLKGQKAKTVGLIVPTLADTFFSACAHAVQQVATQHGYMTLIQSSGRSVEAEMEEIEMMLSRNVAGLILVPMETAVTTGLRHLESRNVPVVSLDRRVRGLHASEVLVENAEGARKAVQHLIEHGHQRIAALGYDTGLYSIKQRISGYTAAMRAAGLAPTVWKAESAEQIATVLAQRFRQAGAPTALFTLNNVSTIQLLHWVRDRGMRIPAQVALAAFDDLELASLLDVPITAVRQPSEEIGRRGARLLFGMIQDSEAQKLTRTALTLPTELVIRRSCGCGMPSHAG